jgi:hypothetical protein
VKATGHNGVFLGMSRVRVGYYYYYTIWILLLLLLMLLLLLLPIPVATLSKAWLYGRSLAGIAGSNISAGMDICIL